LQKKLTVLGAAVNRLPAPNAVKPKMEQFRRDEASLDDILSQRPIRYSACRPSNLLRHHERPSLFPNGINPLDRAVQMRSSLMIDRLHFQLTGILRLNVSHENLDDQLRSLSKSHLLRLRAAVSRQLLARSWPFAYELGDACSDEEVA
uniref:Spindle pole body component n=1 Tax=Toxocara canis TaxID=6265 RepID=A0A183VBG6_TOXCA